MRPPPHRFYLVSYLYDTNTGGTALQPTNRKPYLKRMVSALEAVGEVLKLSNYGGTSSQVGGRALWGDNAPLRLIATPAR